MAYLKQLVTCPYCGFQQNKDFKIDHVKLPNQLVMQCDSEDGGCDEHFAVFYDLNIQVHSAGIMGCGVDLKEKGETMSKENDFTTDKASPFPRLDHRFRSAISNSFDTRDKCSVLNDDMLNICIGLTELLQSLFRHSEISKDTGTVFYALHALGKELLDVQVVVDLFEGVDIAVVNEIKRALNKASHQVVLATSLFETDDHMPSNERVCLTLESIMNNLSWIMVNVEKISEMARNDQA